MTTVGVGVGGCSGDTEHQLESVASAAEVRWEDDPGDPLEVGPLDGQNGWIRAPGFGSADVVTWAADNRVIKLASDVDGQPRVVMGKEVLRQTAGHHVLELDVMVEHPNLANLTTLDLNTDPRTVEECEWATKKLRFYFGSAIRIETGPGPDPVSDTLVPQVVAGQWYHLRADIDLNNEVVSVWLGADLTAVNNRPLGPGPIVGLSLAGWDGVGQANA
ncbi:MAG TPA: hypothetical protein VFB52_11710, partial [Solirubrobacterales bacterium]|nr:hypothetical protein [Solirubrobacterales bacterium]